MRGFGKGFATGALIAISMAALVAPMDKRAMRKIKCKTNKLIHNVNSAINSMF